MKEVVKLTGMIIKISPVGEFDKRLVILTRKRGKITAFARGARRPGNQLMGASRLFAFGSFSFYEGRDAYNLVSAEIENYFENIAFSVEWACYASYFAELADYYARENMDATEMLKLLYQSMRALENKHLDNKLVQRIFELKSMVIGGEYTEKPPLSVSESTEYTWEFILWTPIEKLYSFVVSEEVLKELGKCVDYNKSRFIDMKFHSLEILKEIVS